MIPVIPRFFGQYLLEKDVLSKDQLIGSINYQKSKILKLGEIAIIKEFLTEKEVAKIHNEQKRTDMRFGDLAIDLKLLTQHQLDEMVTYQKNNHIYLGEAIVAMGYLDQATVDQELAAFKKDQESLPQTEVMIADDIKNKESVEVMVDLSCKLLRRIGDMMSKTGQLMHVEGELKNLGIASTLDFKGDVKCCYIINMSWEVGHQIAKKTFKKEELPFDEELIADTVSEFVNVVCGNVRSKLLETGKSLDFDPPCSYVESKAATIPLKAGEVAIVIPVYTPIGNLEIAIVS